MINEEESYAIRGALYEVYSVLGVGFLEDVYQEAVEHEFSLRGIPFEARQKLRIPYKDVLLDKIYIADLVCYGKIIVELKSVKELLPVHEAQLLNYLSITGFKLGFLVNFNHHPKLDIKRLVK